MTQNYFMASLDLKDAYYRVSVDPLYCNYLKFNLYGRLYQYTAYPNGLSSCPMSFAKLTKRALSCLRKDGHIITACINDLYMQGNTFAECLATVIAKTKLSTQLGFIIHPDKLNFIPSQQLTRLGFILNSKDMTVKPTQDKIVSVRNPFLPVYSAIQKLFQNT